MQHQNASVSQAAFNLNLTGSVLSLTDTKTKQQ